MIYCRLTKYFKIENYIFQNETKIMGRVALFYIFASLMSGLIEENGYLYLHLHIICCDMLFGKERTLQTFIQISEIPRSSQTPSYTKFH